MASPAPKLGDNRPALITAEQLSHDFGHIETAITAALKAADGVPQVIEDEEDLNVAREAVRTIMGEAKRAESTRVDSKSPYLDAERVVDSYFHALKTKLEKAKAELERRAKFFLAKKERREREAREEEARIAREAEEKRRLDAAKAQALADARRMEAEQAARENEATATAAKDEADRAAAEAARAQAHAAAAAAEMAAAQARAEEKPADLARTRVSSGGMATLKRVYKFEITDLAAINLNLLKPYFTQADIEKAIGRHVNIHKDDNVLSGVRVWADSETVMR